MINLIQEAAISNIDWQADNQAFLEAELHKLRLLLHRRVLWLRKQWKQDEIQPFQGWVITDSKADWILTGEDYSAEIEFFQQDAEAIAKTNEIKAVDQDLADRFQAMVAEEMPPAIDMVSVLFDLSTFERHTLLLCLAPIIDQTFEQLFAYVQDDVNRKFPTPHLSLTLLREDEDSLQLMRDAFMPHAPLRRFSLLTLGDAPEGTAPGARPLYLDERMAAYLKGLHQPESRVQHLLRPIPTTPLPPTHAETVDKIADSLEDSMDNPFWQVLNLTGPPGIGKGAVARKVCDRLGLLLQRLDIHHLPPPGPERQNTFRLLEREAILSQIAYYIEADEVGPDEKAAGATLRDVIDQLGVFIIIGSLGRVQCDRESLCLRLLKPSTSDQYAMWQQILSEVPHALDGHLNLVAQQFEFGPNDFMHVLGAAWGQTSLRSADENPEIIPQDIWQACREHSGWQIEELAQRIISCYEWQDIVLPEDTNRQLKEIAAQVKNRHHVYETWGFGEKLSRGRGISALFSGPSGTGKTMAAEILANYLNLDLYRIDLAGVVSKYIGETEKNLRKVFDTAQQSGAILFFDEADALFGKRTEVKDSHDRYANIEVNYLLQRMEDYRGLAILATNRKSDLDWAFLRRLRFIVEFPFPSAEDRRRIWSKVFPDRSEVGDLDYLALARLEITGGNIKNIAVNAAFLAAEEETSIDLAHVLHASRREYEKIDKLITEAEFGGYFQVLQS